MNKRYAYIFFSSALVMGAFGGGYYLTNKSHERNIEKKLETMYSTEKVKNRQEKKNKHDETSMEKIVIKITDDGYVVSHGDHFHFHEGKVPYDSLISEDLIMKDSSYVFNKKDIISEVKDGYIIKWKNKYYLYLKDDSKKSNIKKEIKNNSKITEVKSQVKEDTYVFNPKDIVSETKDGYIVRHGDHFHFIFKQNTPASTIQVTKNKEDHYTFNPKDIVSETKDGYVVKHGDHFHFVLKNTVTPVTNHITSPLVSTPLFNANQKNSISVNTSQLAQQNTSIKKQNKNWNRHLMEIAQVAKKYDVSKEDVRVSGNIIIVPHGDHHHVHFSKNIVDWEDFLKYNPKYAFKKDETKQAPVSVNNQTLNNDKKETWNEYYNELDELALIYGVKRESIKLSGAAIIIPHEDHEHIYMSNRIKDWSDFLIDNPQYLYTNAIEQSITKKEDEIELNLDDLIVDNQIKMQINMELERYDDISHPISDKDLESLVSLDLFGSDLSDFRFLIYAKNLISLNLGNNRNLTNDDLRYLSDLKKLRNLTLNGNTQISNIENINHLSLEELKISETGIPTLYQLKNFTKLKKLDASLMGAHNHDETSGIEHDHSSKKSDRHEELSKINIEILSKMIDMEDLDISGNSLTDVSFVKEMPNIKRLYVEGSYLSSLSGLGYAKNLEILNASNNEIFDIKDIELIENIQDINLSNNHIKNISFVSHKPNLKNLDLGYNKIESVKNLTDLDKLTTLTLKGNRLTTLSELNQFNNLERLQIDNNNIFDLSFAYRLSKLVSLSASNNSLHSIKPLIKLPNIQEVIVNNNFIDDNNSFNELLNKSLFNLSINDQNIYRKLSIEDNKLLGNDYSYEIISAPTGVTLTDNNRLIVDDINKVSKDIKVKFKSNKNDYNVSYNGEMHLSLEKTDVQEVKDASEPADVQEVKDASEPADVQEVKDASEPADVQEVKDVQAAEDPSEVTDTNE